MTTESDDNAERRIQQMQALQLGGADFQPPSIESRAAPEGTFASDDLTEINRSADTLAYFVLIRRLFVEMARSPMRGTRWLQEQEELAQHELDGIRHASGKRVIASGVMHRAAATITQVLSGITIRG